VARPRLEIGTCGKIFHSRLPTGVRARAFVRGPDGRRREVTRMGRTETLADQALKRAVRDLVALSPADDLSGDTAFSVVAERWFAELDGGGEKSPSTIRAYRDRIDNQIVPSLGGLPCRSVTVGLADRFLAGVVKTNGPSVARMTRSVMSGICGYAARQGAMDRNPIRDVGRIAGKPKRAPRSLELDEGRQFIAYMTYHDPSMTRDVLDLVLFMLATGMRVGEASAVVWDAVDLDAGTVQVRGTVLRVKGVGLRVRPQPKSVAGWRALKLPDWAAELLRARREKAPTDGVTLLTDGGSWPSAPVFPSADKGGLRDPSNTQKHLRSLFDFCGVDITSHALRKTVATLMERAGLGALNAADQLGHAKPSMTLDVYFGRFQVRDTGAAEVLGRPGPGAGTPNPDHLIQPDAAGGTQR